MGAQRGLLDLVVSLGGGRNHIVFNPVFATLMGSVEAGVFLSQLLYWCDKGKENDGWFHKSYPQWKEETTLSRYLVDKYAKTCEEMGFLEREIRYAKNGPVTHWRVRVDALVQLLIQPAQPDASESESADTHTHAESNSETDHEIFNDGPSTVLTMDHQNCSRSTVKLFDGLYGTQITTQITTQNKSPSDSHALRETEQAALFNIGSVSESADSPPRSAAPPQRVRVVTDTEGTKAVLAAYVSACGYKPASYSQEATAAKRCASAGYTPDDVVVAYNTLKTQPFWASKHLSLATVFKELPALQKFAQEGGDINTIGKRESNVDRTIAAARSVSERLRAMGREDLLGE